MNCRQCLDRCLVQLVQKRTLINTTKMLRKFKNDPLFDPRVVQFASEPITDSIYNKSKFKIFENPKKKNEDPQNYDCAAIQSGIDKLDIEGQYHQYSLWHRL